MNDYIKMLNVATNPEKLQNNPLLLDYWETNVKKNDGEIKREFADYFKMRFNIKNGNVKLNGSIHKYRNHGEHNYDDFTCTDAIEVIKGLCKDFEIDAFRTEINNLEFGVNVELPFPVKLVLDNLIIYKGGIFEEKVKDGMRYYQCEKTHFIIKIYDKGLQYHLPYNLLRFEIKVIRKQYFEWFKIPIYWLSDLLNPDIYPRMAEVLVATFNDILFNDNRIDINTLTKTEQLVFYKGSNPNEWKGASKSEREKKERQRFRNDFVNLLERERKGIDFRTVVLEKIRSKSFELSRSYQKNETLFSLFETTLKGEIVPFLHFKYSVRTGHENNSITTLTTSTPEPKIKKCSGCGKPLNEGQKTYHGESCKIRKFERNGRSNPRNNERNGFINQYERVFKKPSLFDLSELIKTTPQQNEWLTKSSFNN